MTVSEVVDFHFLLTCRENTSPDTQTNCIQTSMFTVSRLYFQYISLISPPKPVLFLGNLTIQSMLKADTSQWNIHAMSETTFCWWSILPAIFQRLVIAEKEVMNFFAQNTILLVREYGTCLTMPAKKLCCWRDALTDLLTWNISAVESLELINAVSLAV